ncbi:MAG TPA: hypothetical protein VI424_08955, partial [Terriglobales bacterium]
MLPPTTRYSFKTPGEWDMVSFGRGVVRRSRAAAAPILFAILSLVILAAYAAASPQQAAIMAVGDVHGDFDDFVLI